MIRYKCIFDNNNKKLVTEFFQDQLIKKLWANVIQPNMSYQLCFEKTDRPNPDIELTYREITRIMRDDFKLDMPDWWVARFPATPFKLTKKWFFTPIGENDFEDSDDTLTLVSPSEDFSEESITFAQPLMLGQPSVNL